MPGAAITILEIMTWVMAFLAAAGEEPSRVPSSVNTGVPSDSSLWDIIHQEQEGKGKGGTDVFRMQGMLMQLAAATATNGT